MGEDHQFHKLMRGENKSPVERALIAAIMLLSVESYSHLTPEQIFDQLELEYNEAFGDCSDTGQPFLSMIYRRILLMDKSITNQLNRMEKTELTTSTAVSRLQTDNDQLKSRVGSLQTSLTSFMNAAADAYARFQKSLDDLKNQAGDDAALNAIAGDMEATLGTLKTINDQADAGTVTAGGEDVTTAPPPPPPTSLTIQPNPGSVAPGNTLQFTIKEGTKVQWSASAGSIDDSGLYTPAPDATVTSDTVTAKTPDGFTATASVTIG